MTTSRSTLTRIEGGSEFRGFFGMLGVELRVWFPWRVLVLTLAGIGVFASIYIPWRLTETNRLGPLILFAMALWMVVLLIATISISEGTVLGDIERGTASWLVGMPIGRPAVIVAKSAASAVGMSAAVFLTGGLFYPLLESASQLGVTDFSVDQLREVTEAPIGNWGAFAVMPELGTYLSMLAAISVLVTFLVAVMVALGTMIRSRTAVFGLGIAVFGGLVAGWFGAREALEASPVGLVGALSEGIQNRPMTVGVPAVATIALSFVLVAVAAWRFQRRDLR